MYLQIKNKNCIVLLTFLTVKAMANYCKKNNSSCLLSATELITPKISYDATNAIMSYYTTYYQRDIPYSTLFGHSLRSVDHLWL